MGDRSVDQVGEDGFDDGVATVGDVGGRGRFDTVGEEWVVAPDRACCAVDPVLEVPGGSCRALSALGGVHFADARTMVPLASIPWCSLV